MFWVNLQTKDFECLDAPLVCTKCGFVSDMVKLDRFIDDRRVCFACWGQPWKQPAGVVVDIGSGPTATVDGQAITHCDTTDIATGTTGGIYLGRLTERRED